MVRLYKWKKDLEPDDRQPGKLSDNDDVSLPPLDSVGHPSEETPSEDTFVPPDLKFPDIESASAARKKSRDNIRRRGEILEQPLAQKEVPEPESSPQIQETIQPSLQLYSFVKRDRSSRVAWLLRELDLPFEQRWLDPYQAEHLSREYLQLNPFGRVPVLELNDLTLFESGAIMTHLLEAFGDDRVIPEASSSERPYFWQWFFWGHTTLDSAVIDFLNELPTAEENEQDLLPQNQVDPAAYDQLQSVLEPLEAHLSGQTYLLPEFSAADIVVGHMLGLLSRRFEFHDFPVIEDYLNNLLRRPAAEDFLEGLEE